MPLAFDAQQVGDCRYGFAETPFLRHEWSGGDFDADAAEALERCDGMERFLTLF